MSRSVWAWGRVVGSALTLAVLVWRLGAGPFLDGHPLSRRRGAGGSGRHPSADHGVLCVAVEDRRRWSRRRFVTARCGGGVLPVAVPQRHAARRDRGRRPSRGQPRSRRERRRPRVAVRRVGTLRRAGRSGPPDGSRSTRAAVARALVHAAGGDRGCRGGTRHRARGAGAARWRSVCVGATLGAAAGDIRDGLLSRRAWPGIALASLLVVAGHAATFLIAARTAGTTAPPSRMLPIALLVIAAMVLPSVAGWGPREGVAAWVFGAAGLGAQRGVSTAVVYGVMVLVASLPGAAVLVFAWFRRTRPPGRTEPPLRERPSA